MQGPRSDHCALTIGEKSYVFGGCLKVANVKGAKCQSPISSIQYYNDTGVCSGKAVWSNAGDIVEKRFVVIVIIIISKMYSIIVL